MPETNKITLRLLVELVYRVFFKPIVIDASMVSSILVHNISYNIYCYSMHSWFVIGLTYTLLDHSTPIINHTRINYTYPWPFISGVHVGPSEHIKCLFIIHFFAIFCESDLWLTYGLVFVSIFMILALILFIFIEIWQGILW